MNTATLHLVTTAIEAAKVIKGTFPKTAESLEQAAAALDTKSAAEAMREFNRAVRDIWDRDDPDIHGH